MKEEGDTVPYLGQRVTVDSVPFFSPPFLGPFRHSTTLNRARGCSFVLGTCETD